MTKTDIIEKLAAHGIYHLYRGESAQDALDFVDGKINNRVGVQVYRNDGTKFTEQEIKNRTIATSYKEAFAKTVHSPNDYTGPDFDLINKSMLFDTPDDMRENKKVEGYIEPCKYCNGPVLVDIAFVGEDWTNCSACMNYAIWENCMI